MNTPTSNLLKLEIEGQSLENSRPIMQTIQQLADKVSKSATKRDVQNEKKVLQIQTKLRQDKRMMINGSKQLDLFYKIQDENKSFKLSHFSEAKDLESNPCNLFLRLGFVVKESIKFKETQVLLPFMRATVHIGHVTDRFNDKNDKNDKIYTQFNLEGEEKDDQQLKQLARYFLNEFSQLFVLDSLQFKTNYSDEQ